MQDTFRPSQGLFPSNTALVIVVLCIIALIGSWNFYLRNSPKTENPVSTPSPLLVTASPTPSPQATEPAQTITYLSPPDWVAYSLPSIGLRFSLPARARTLGKLSEKTVRGEAGVQYCVQFSSIPVSSGSAGPRTHGCPTRANGLLSIGTTSVDYAAGRSGEIFDFQGFFENAGNISLRFIGGSTMDIPEITKYRLMTANQTEILRIDGQVNPEGGPTIQNSLGGRVALIVNTQSPKYPGTVFVFESNGGFTSEEIDQIAASISLPTPLK